MDKKILLPIIILSAFVIDLIVGRVLYNVYLNSGYISSTIGYGYYTISTMSVSFVLSSFFYVFILMYFPENKHLSIFAALSLLVAFSFAGYVSLSNFFEFNTIIVKLYASISYFIGFANIIVATSIVLKELHTKIVTVSILYIAIIQFVFGTLVVDYVRGYLAGFFGPYENDLVIVFAVYDVFLILIRLSVVVLQVMSIRSLFKVQQGHVRVYRRM